MQMRVFAKIEPSAEVEVGEKENLARFARPKSSLRLRVIRSITRIDAVLICKLFAMILVNHTFNCANFGQARCLSAQDLDSVESNHTSFFLDSDTNVTGAARYDDHKALAQANTVSSKPYENISLILEDGKRHNELPLPEIVYDDDDEVAKQLSDDTDAEIDDDYEDDHDFYKRNPVDTINFKLEDKESPNHDSVDKSNGKRTKSKNLVDFDDQEALDLESFYNPGRKRKKKKKKLGKRKRFGNKELRKTGRRKLRPQARRISELGPASERLGAKKRSSKLGEEPRSKGNFISTLQQHNASESRDQPQGTGTDSLDSCAISLETGRCITFASIEWAIRRARRMIGFASPGLQMLSSLEPSESTINAVGELNEWTTRLLATRFAMSPNDINFALEQLDISQTSLWRSCPRLFRSPAARSCRTSGAQQTFPGRFRTHTGQCNNPLLPHLGSSFMPFARFIPADYADGVGSMRRSSGTPNQLPPARLVSLTLHPNFEQPAGDHSALFANWGQLINHDLALASGARAGTGHDGSCCSRSALAQPADPADALNRVCAPIFIARGDPVYSPYGVRCHDFKRSIAALRPGCTLGPRTQLNLVTSFVDGSFVYGSTRSVGVSLRSEDGRLATWNYFRARRGPAGRLKPLLPPQVQEPDEECLGRRRGLFCFRSGDMRTNQQVPLVLLHTLHTRQHNRLADALFTINPHWSAGRVYEEARRIHIAQIQHILISEYLPLLLGQKLCQSYNLTETQLDEYFDGYEPTEQPGISQEFAAAAFRQGHSSVPNLVFRFDVATRRPKRFYRLRELFRQPWPLFEPGAMDEFALGLVETAAQSVDPFVSLELTGHLLEEPGEPIGLDLIAINIQRGRDQGVAGYNRVREFCGLSVMSDFGDLAKVMNNASAEMMASLYESVDDIDLYSGGLSEWPLEGAQVGPTFACIIGHQFRTLRLADRFWFEASPMVAGPAGAFTLGQLASIKQFTLARLLCANSDAIQYVQASAMQLPHPILNPPVACNMLPDIELNEWVELQPVANQASEDDDDDDDR